MTTPHASATWKVPARRALAWLALSAWALLSLTLWALPGMARAGEVADRVRERNQLLRPWVKGYKKHPILYTNFKYLDVDVAARAASAP